jgi:hypothetical protein
MTLLGTLREEGYRNTIRVRRSAADRLADKNLAMAARKEKEERKKAREAEIAINKAKSAKKKETKIGCRCDQETCIECLHRIRHRMIIKILRTKKKEVINSIPQHIKETEIRSLYFQELTEYSEKYAHRSANMGRKKRHKTVIPKGFQEVEIHPEEPQKYPRVLYSDFSTTS